MEKLNKKSVPFCWEYFEACHRCFGSNDQLNEMTGVLFLVAAARTAIQSPGPKRCSFLLRYPDADLYCYAVTRAGSCIVIRWVLRRESTVTIIVFVALSNPTIYCRYNMHIFSDIFLRVNERGEKSVRREPVFLWVNMFLVIFSWTSGPKLKRRYVELGKTRVFGRMTISNNVRRKPIFRFETQISSTRRFRIWIFAEHTKIVT